MRWAWRLWAGAACVSLLVACGGTDTIAPTSPRAPADPAPTADGSGRGSGWAVRLASPRELVVSLTGSPPGAGPCGARLRARAEEDAARVRLSIVDDNAGAGRGGGPVACPAVGHLWALPVTLERPLGGRTVVDAGGEPVHAVDALAPTWLPDGYRLTTESGSPSSYSLTHTAPDGGWLVVSTWAADAVGQVEARMTPAGERTVDGRVLRLLGNGPQRVVAVDVDGRQAWVSWMPLRQDSTARISWDELVEVARSVR